MKKANVDDDRKLSRRLLSTPRYHLDAVPCNLKFGKVQTQEANFIIGNGITKGYIVQNSIKLDQLLEYH